MIDNLRQLAIFAKIAECHSISAAAKSLGLSISVTSHHLKELEQRLGLALIYRSTRKLALTAEGKKILKHAQAMLSHAEQCLSLVASHSKEPSGDLKISMASILMHSEVMDKIATFHLQYPKINLEICFSDLRVDLIGQQFDAAIRIGSMPDSSLKSKKIDSIERCIVTTPNLAKKITHVGQFEKTAWVGVSMLPLHRTLLGPRGEKKKIKFHSSIMVNSVDAAMQLAKRGCGLASPPTYLAKPLLESKQLCLPLPKWKPSSLDVYFVWHQNNQPEGLTNLLKKHLSLS